MKFFVEVIMMVGMYVDYFFVLVNGMFEFVGLCEYIDYIDISVVDLVFNEYFVGVLFKN